MFLQTSCGTEPDTELEAEISHPAETDLDDAVQSHATSCNYPLPRRVVVSNTDQGATVMLLDKTGVMRHGKIQVKATNQEPPKKRNPTCTHWVDVLSRMLFPACYVIFLVLFWRKYVQQLPI